ncbi:MAG TPA: DHA2 family efflux MFS transporter permease subunit [Rhizomicrobium sp.]|nr:DHA2 family efflux MFS transporter permease subunit [Rhizomicrobium sp.]
MSPARADETAPPPDFTMHGAALAAAVFVLALANFMAILDLTIINVAVPHIAGALAVSPTEGTWVITSYAVAEAVTVPLSGWLASRFGTVRVFTVSALGFGVFSALCGFAPTLPALVGARVLQGLAGGPLMPMSQTLLLRIAPPKHANMAMGLWMMTTILAPVGGPLLGGTIADTVGWPWAFFLNVPVSIVCAFLAFQMLRSRETGTQRNPIDFVGLALLVVFVGSLQVMLDNGQNEDWFGSTFIIALAVVAGVAFLSLLIWELTDLHPIVDLRIFRHRGFAVSCAAIGVCFGAFFATIVLLPLWLQTTMGYTATWSGYVMAFQAMLGVVMAPVVATLVSRVDPRALMSTGLVLVSITLFARSNYTPDITFFNLVLPQLFMGLGMPLFFVPLMMLAVTSVGPEETASASGLVNFVRTMAGAFGAALITAAWTSTSSFTRANMVGALNHPGAALGAMMHAGMPPAKAKQMLDGLVEKQAVMVATDHLFMALGALIAITAVAVWLMPRPPANVSAMMGH